MASGEQITEVIQEICDKYEITRTDLRSRNKNSYYTLARMELVFRLRKLDPVITYAFIGKTINRRNLSVGNLHKRYLETSTLIQRESTGSNIGNQSPVYP